MKLKISNVIDLSRFLTTRSGQELKELLEYISRLGDEVVTSLTSNLTYEDNFLCEIKQVSIRTGTSNIIKTSKNLPVKEIRIRRVYDDIYFIVSSFGWTYTAQGEILVNSTFISQGGSSDINREIVLDLIIFYG
tara:strand:- start:514 stop:915 length:402 start_codon:yes stop_codon:yes gene_type:complete